MVFLTQPVQIKWVRVTPVSVIKHYFKLSNWYGWMKFFEIDWNCSLSLMTFSMSLLIVLSKTMSLKALGKLYDSLLGLGIMMNIETLKCTSQWPSSKHVSAILMIFLKHALFLMILLKYLYDNLSGLGVNKLLYLSMELMNFASKNGFQVIMCFLGIFFNRLILIWQFCTVLKDKWSTGYKLLISIHG